MVFVTLKNQFKSKTFQNIWLIYLPPYLVRGTTELVRSNSMPSV